MVSIFLTNLNLSKVLTDKIATLYPRMYELHSNHEPKNMAKHRGMLG
jgi:hypothetical protein